MRRRQFIAGLGSAAATWPLAAQAQQGAIPIIAYLSVRSAESDQQMLAAFRRGLNELGFEENRNLVIEYRFADGQYDRVPNLATELVSRHVSVIVFPGSGAIRGLDAPWPELRASQIPVVFNTGGDPVRQGLVARLNRPGGNFTGVNTFAGELTGKVFEFLHELVPGAKAIGVITFFGVGDNPPMRDAREAAAALGMQLFALSAGTDAEIEKGFAALKERRVDAIHVGRSCSPRSPPDTTFLRRTPAASTRKQAG
jgi:putative tryptophan/tyrosine transport system substrate-binding protein